MFFFFNQESEIDKPRNFLLKQFVTTDGLEKEFEGKIEGSYP